MILSHEAILKEIKAKRIKISPFSKDSVGPASIDLTLGNKIRVFENIDRAIRVTGRSDYKKITRAFNVKKRFRMKPGQLILGITKEKITLPNDICGWLNSRSRFARLGLMVHITAPFIQPGVSNKQVLEIYNAGPNNLDIFPGEKLCQLILERCEGSATYSGKFKKQTL
ncbi:dCTP deaminase [Candidatus Woesearchaeota archaeon CG07_land_8_20_14_0_80_44_23]|nr:MAG: dCTP deaminase [Candidatus Woesearchaeota archaeon CG07_land_8_20_14_0_80_44_23]